MALSTEAKRVLKIALAEGASWSEIAAAIDASTAAVAANVAALGVTTDLVGVDGAGSNAAPLVGTEARLDDLDAKVDAVIAALITAGLMAAS